MRIRQENEALQTALNNVLCPPCGGPPLGRQGRELIIHQLRLENIHLKQEVRVYCKYFFTIKIVFPFMIKVLIFTCLYIAKWKFIISYWLYWFYFVNFEINPQFSYPRFKTSKSWFCTYMKIIRFISLFGFINS